MVSIKDYCSMWELAHTDMVKDYSDECCDNLLKMSMDIFNELTSKTHLTDDETIYLVTATSHINTVKSSDGMSDDLFNTELNWFDILKSITI